MDCRPDNQRPVILALCDYYLPGYKGGGPIRSLSNLVTELCNGWSFSIVTRDRDCGETASYKEVTPGSWQAVGKAQVLYLPSEHRMARLRQAISETPHDVLYLNSLFSPVFSIWPLMLKRFGVVKSCPVVLAPRGELHPGALQIHRARKEAYLALARTLHLHRGVVWHASSSCERRYIRARFGRNAQIRIAPNLCQAPPLVRCHQPVKRPGHLKIVFLSRISRNKNLHGAISLLHGLSGKVQFHIYGPYEDAGYWSKCQRLISELPSNVHVVAHGPVHPSEVPGVLARHHLLLLPSHGENFGHVIAEALLAGCLVLISDRTPWRSLTKAGVGWDVPLGERETFHSVLRRCLAMNDTEYQTLSRRAQDYGELVSSENRPVVQTEKLFGDALRRRVA